VLVVVVLELRVELRVLAQQTLAVVVAVREIMLEHQVQVALVLSFFLFQQQITQAQPQDLQLLPHLVQTQF
jgi:hypothetical protein